MAEDIDHRGFRYKTASTASVVGIADIADAVAATWETGDRSEVRMPCGRTGITKTSGADAKNLFGAAIAVCGVLAFASRSAADESRFDLHLKHFKKSQLIVLDDFVYVIKDSEQRKKLHEYVLQNGIGYRDDSILVTGYIPRHTGTYTVRSPEFFEDCYRERPTVFELAHYRSVRSAGNWTPRPDSLMAEHALAAKTWTGQSQFAPLVGNWKKRLLAWMDEQGDQGMGTELKALERQTKGSLEQLEKRFGQ